MFALLSIDPSPTHRIRKWLLLKYHQSYVVRGVPTSHANVKVEVQRHIHLAEMPSLMMLYTLQLTSSTLQWSEENHATPMKRRSCFVSFCCIYTSPKCMLISTDGKAHVRPHSVANFNRDSLRSITNSLANFSQVCPWHILAIDVHTCALSPI